MAELWAVRDIGTVSAVEPLTDRLVVFHRNDVKWTNVFPTGLIPQSCLTITQSSSGNVLRSFGKGNQFVMPHGMHVQNQEHFWVTDVGRHQVVLIDPQGDEKLCLGVHGQRGCDSSHFNMPTSVVTDACGYIFVADGYGNGRILQFSQEGEIIHTFGTKGTDVGQFLVPHGLCVTDSALVVADRENRRLQVLDPRAQRVQAVWCGDDLGKPYTVKTLEPQSHRLLVTDISDLTRNASRVLWLDLAAGAVLRQLSVRGHAHDACVMADGNVAVGDIYDDGALRCYESRSNV